jgi:hypothetical protein
VSNEVFSPVSRGARIVADAFELTERVIQHRAKTVRSLHA